MSVYFHIIVLLILLESAKMMREAADILDTRPAMQIRYLETI